jgi:hypothetical protein
LIGGYQRGGRRWKIIYYASYNIIEKNRMQWNEIEWNRKEQSIRMEGKGAEGAEDVGDHVCARVSVSVRVSA